MLKAERETQGQILGGCQHGLATDPRKLRDTWSTSAPQHSSARAAPEFSIWPARVRWMKDERELKLKGRRSTR